MLESLFYFSTRDQLLVCRWNRKVIKNILKPGNGVWGSGLNRKILAASSFCPIGAPVPILFIHLLTHALMLLWHYIFIWWFVFLTRLVYQCAFYQLFFQKLTDGIPGAGNPPPCYKWVIACTLMSNGQVNKSALITKSQILLFDVWGRKACWPQLAPRIGGRGFLHPGFIISIFWRDWLTYPRFQASKWKIWI